MIRIRFDGPSGPVGPRFIEAEDGQGRGVCIGHWEPDPESTDWFLVLLEENPLEGYPCPVCGRKPEQLEEVTDRVDFSRYPRPGQEVG